MSKIKPLESIGFVGIKDYSRYLKFNVLKGKYYRIKTMCVAMALTVICLWLLLAGWANNDKSLWVVAGVILLCTLMFFYTVNTNVKRICNSKAKTVRAKQRTEFGKNGFVFELMFEDETENEFSEIFYDEVETIYLAPHAIYIYIEKRSVIIIPKRNLKITPFEARVFLTKFVPAEKLVVCV